MADNPSPLTGYSPPAWGKWQPGQSGNPEGGRIKKRYREAIARALALMDKDDPGKTEVQIAAAHVGRALSGDMAAIKEFADRVEGKVPQGHGQDDELGPQQMVVSFRTESDA